MRNLLALLIIILFSFSACKESSGNKTTKATTTSSQKVSTGALFANIPGPKVAASLRQKGAALIDYREEHGERAFWPIIESGVWQFMFVFNGNEMEKPSAEVIKWIDFKKDGTFDFGEGTKVLTSGRYNYSLDKQELIVLDNDERAGPNGWSVNLVGAAMVLLGNAELSSNGYQMKLEKLDSRPQ